MEHMNFKEYVNQFVETESPDWTVTTARDYTEIINRLLLPAFGEMEIEDIKRPHIKKFQNDLRARELSPATINKYMAVLRVIMKTAMEDEVITVNPCKTVSRVESEASDIKPLSLSELKRVIAAADDYIRPLFITLAFTGMRHGEAFALRWEDVDLGAGVIRITRNRVRGNEKTPKTKAGKRTIEILAPVRQALEALERKSEYVFLTAEGKPYNRPIDRQWRRACERAGVEYRRPYEMRHSYATLCLSRGVPINHLSHVLGHSNPAITGQIYARYAGDSASIASRLQEDLQAV